MRKLSTTISRVRDLTRPKGKLLYNLLSADCCKIQPLNDDSLELPSTL